MALLARTLCAVREGLAFRVRQDEFPCDQMVQAQDLQHGNHRVLQRSYL